MTLLNSTILRRPLFIQTGALMSPPFETQEYRWPPFGRIKHKYCERRDWKPIAQRKKQFQGPPWHYEVQYTQNYQFTVENYWTALCLTPGLYSNHNEFWGDFPVDVCWGYNTSPSTAAHSSSPESNSQCHTQFHSLTDPRLTCTGACASYTQTHTHTHTNKGFTVLIAFCPPLKGRPPGSCSPSIGFIMAAAHPSSCCFTLKTRICLFSPSADGSPFAPTALPPFTTCWPVTPQRALPTLFFFPRH